MVEINKLSEISIEVVYNKKVLFNTYTGKLLIKLDLLEILYSKLENNLLDELTSFFVEEKIKSLVTTPDLEIVMEGILKKRPEIKKEEKNDRWITRYIKNEEKVDYCESVLRIFPLYLNNRIPEFCDMVSVPTATEDALKSFIIEASNYKDKIHLITSESLRMEIFSVVQPQLNKLLDSFISHLKSSYRYNSLILNSRISFILDAKYTDLFLHQTISSVKLDQDDLSKVQALSKKHFNYLEGDLEGLKLNGILRAKYIYLVNNNYSYFDRTNKYNLSKSVLTLMELNEYSISDDNLNLYDRVSYGSNEYKLYKKADDFSNTPVLRIPEIIGRPLVLVESPFSQKSSQSSSEKLQKELRKLDKNDTDDYVQMVNMYCTSTLEYPSLRIRPFPAYYSREFIGINIYTPVIESLEYIWDSTAEDFVPSSTIRMISKDTDGKFDYILNEDGLGCLLDNKISEVLTLKPLYRENLDARCPPSKRTIKKIFKLLKISEIRKHILKEIDELNSLNYETIRDKFIENYLNIIMDRLNRDLETTNEFLKYEFYINLEKNYFYHKLFHSRKSKFTRVALTHQFIIVDLAALDHTEFGRMAELAFSRYLNQNVSGLNWYDTNDNFFDSPTDCKVEWANMDRESFDPYDFIIKFDKSIFIEVKATRYQSENVFYMSIRELKKMLDDKDNYIIARMFLLKEGSEEYAIKVNDEFAVCFYKFNQQAISEIVNRIDEWENFYEENKIRFTTEHLREIEDLFDPDIIVPPYQKHYDLTNIGSKFDLNEKFIKFNNEEYFPALELTINKLIDYFIDNPDCKNIFSDLMVKLHSVKTSEKFTCYKPYG